MQDLSDEDLIARSRLASHPPGQDPFLNELFRRHQRKIALWCLRWRGQKEDAADLSQEVMALAHRNLDSFQGGSKFTTWLYTVCRNHCINDARSRAARMKDSTEPLELDLADAREESVEKRLVRQETVEIARQWVKESLTETERQVFTLHYVEELPLDAITRVLGLDNASGAKAYVVSARRKLQEAARRWRARHERA
jgi:RNA polymerase sigma-70 factor (ECF subfamily)